MGEIRVSRSPNLEIVKKAAIEFLRKVEKQRAQKRKEQAGASEGRRGMTVKEIFESRIPINDRTQVVIRFRAAGRLTADCGRWFEDRIMGHMEEEVAGFSWDAEVNKLTIRLREQEA